MLSLAEIDVDALVREPVRAEHALGAAERVRHDRQAPRLHQQVAELQRLYRHDRHRDRAGRAAQHHLVRRIESDAKCSATRARQRGMARTRIEHEAERSLAVDADRRPDAADLVAARGGDEARLVGGDGDVVEHDGGSDFSERQ